MQRYGARERYKIQAQINAEEELKAKGKAARKMNDRRSNNVNLEYTPEIYEPPEPYVEFRDMQGAKETNRKERGCYTSDSAVPPSVNVFFINFGSATDFSGGHQQRGTTFESSQSNFSQHSNFGFKTRVSDEGPASAPYEFQRDHHKSFQYKEIRRAETVGTNRFQPIPPTAPQMEFMQNESNESERSQLPKRSTPQKRAEDRLGVHFASADKKNCVLIETSHKTRSSIDTEMSESDFKDCCALC